MGGGPFRVPSQPGKLSAERRSGRTDLCPHTDALGNGTTPGRRHERGSFRVRLQPDDRQEYGDPNQLPKESAMKSKLDLEWRARMSARYGLDAEKIEAWLRVGMTPQEIETWWASKTPEQVTEEQVRLVTFYQTAKEESMTENTYKAIGGRHFANKGIPQLKFDNPELTLEVENAMVTDDVAAVTLAVTLDGQQWSVDGSSKRDPSDRPNHEIGMALAVARAVRRLSDQMMRQASGMTKHADWIELDHKARRQGRSVSEMVGPKKTKPVLPPRDE